MKKRKPRVIWAVMDKDEKNEGFWSYPKYKYAKFWAIVKNEKIVKFIEADRKG